MSMEVHSTIVPGRWKALYMKKWPRGDFVTTRISLGSVVIFNGGNDAWDSCRRCRRAFLGRMTEPAALFVGSILTINS